MKKLWKVRVNNWGWDSPTTIYCESREKAEEVRNRYPAADDVLYAGNFNEVKAQDLIERSLGY